MQKALGTLKCFVASAIDHSDVDAIYDHAICPVLADLNLRPLRVDRVEHNDDIDDKIFGLIDGSDLCIADLTYARPSVYYEAGYAVGAGKPVVYLARRDHLSAGNSVPLGNLKVHFDLQMKNIIPWIKPDDALKERLGARLKHVLKPLVQERKADQLRKDAERAFASTSQRTRLLSLSSKAHALLRTRGYSRGYFPKDGLPGQINHDVPVRRIDKGVYRQIRFFALPSLTRAKLQSLGGRLLWQCFYSREEYAQLKSIQSTCIIGTLAKLRSPALGAMFPSWSPETDRLFRTTEMNSPQNKVPETGIVAVIDGVKSLEEFACEFRRVLATLET